MHEYIKISLKLIWGILLLFWLITSMKNKNTSNKESVSKRFFYYWLPLVIAIYLLGPGEWFGRSIIRENFVPHNNLVGLVGLGLCLVGLIIACWSRYLLGSNWSLSVQQKENHEMITSGIYKLVRHPIYLGLLLLFLGNAIIVGDYRGLIAVLIVFVSFWFKLKKEEIWLTEIFGDKYLEYLKGTKALIPWLI